MGRVGALLLGAAAALGVGAAWSGPAAAESLDEPQRIKLRLFSDRDDDDADGVADAAQSRVAGAAARDVHYFEGVQHVQTRTGGVRLLDGERPVQPPARVQRLGLQGTAPGRFRVVTTDSVIEGEVLAVGARDLGGTAIDLARSHASISRVLPVSLEPGRAAVDADSDALSWTIVGPAKTLPDALRIVSSRPGGEPLDELARVPLLPASCPEGVAPGLECKATPAIRATSDIIDRSHPESSARSLRAEVGGRLVVHVDGRKAAAVRVGGPRHSRLGPLDRFRGKVRVRILRIAKGGAPAIGGDDSAALSMAKEEIRTASGLWGQCGIHFGLDDQLDVEVVDPPPPYLLAFGCDLGLPASGGELRFRLNGKSVSIATRTGQTPIAVAHRVAAELEQLGFTAVVSANARVEPGALPTADVLVRTRDGAMASVTAEAGHPLSSDATLGVCLGDVNLANGLDHFTDYTAVAGTVEERALVKAYADGDPATIEVFVIPSFARTGRIGESFIYADGSSIRNAIILDRAGVRASSRSFALAHEIGHILLDMPGHPDDFGVDRPSMLMDADAADPTIFGPRRLGVDECVRAIVQSGPDAPVPLLEAWPLVEP